MHHTTFCSHKKFYLFFFISTGGTKMNPSKDEQKRSSAVGPRHLNPMHILRNVFTSRITSRFLLTAVWILLLNPSIYCQNLALLKDGLVQHVSSSLTTKGSAFVY